MKKVISWMLSLVMVASLIVSTPFDVQAATTATVTYQVKYCQSDARSELAMVNSFRTGSDAWYWNEDNLTKTICSNLQPLTYDYELERIAMQRCAEIAINYSHSRPDGSNCFTAHKDKSYSYMALGENIAAGHRSAEEVYKAWREDNDNYSGQGHRRNMLSANFNRIGCAGCYYNGTYYWVQEFANSSGNVGSGAANDSLTSVQSTIDLGNTTTKITMPTQISVPEGESVSLPDVQVGIRMNDTFSHGSEYCPLTMSVTPTIADTSVAKIEGGQIKGLKSGSTTLSVSVLNATASAAITVAHVHNYISKVTAATCTAKGYTTYTCANCGDSYKGDEVAALGHNWNSGEVTKEATTTEMGTKLYTCVTCGKTRTETIPMIEVEPEVPDEPELPALKDSKLVSYKKTSKGLEISWKGVENADGYAIYKVDCSSGEKTLLGYIYQDEVDIDDGFTYVDEEISNGAFVSYEALPFRYVDGKVEYAGCETQAYLYLTKNSIKSISNKSDGISLSWAKNAKGDGYQIYRSVNGGSYKKVKSISNKATLSWKDEDVSNGSTYKYKVYVYGKRTVDGQTKTFKSLASSAKTKVYVKRPAFSSAKNVKTRTLALSWKKNSKASGYEIRCARNSDFSSSLKKVAIKKSGTTSYKITKCTKGKTYYVKIRSYKTVNGTKHYSAWSSAKKIKVVR